VWVCIYANNQLVNCHSTTRSCAHYSWIRICQVLKSRAPSSFVARKAITQISSEPGLLTCIIHQSNFRK
jgi:hypothetical protein